MRTRSASQKIAEQLVDTWGWPSSGALDLVDTIATALNQAWAEAIEAAAQVCDAKSGWRDWLDRNGGPWQAADVGAPTEAGAAADWLGAAIRALSPRTEG